ncbi:zinc ribbon domain-containing protein [Nocardia sp. NEAU-G5]|uniref:Zinc ribbon domain-containing protein n=1 Tax=Nocardia albiluteola TaxID=2842303 RepID=A0ABS6BAT3_9NOCA|nr:zinc-ribbon domain-containing protein [Nocardia albiluteola]MBU3066269.1 zinc ribbon domain-containing protein [Nocardia albiluteola]
MIIFGTRSYLYQLAMLLLACGRCGNTAAHVLRKRETKFTLFFIPLFTTSTTYTTQCTYCGIQQQGTEQQANQLLAYANQQPYGQPRPSYQP